MATDKQLEFFRYLFEHEAKRYEHLAERAKLYFAVISFYLGAIAFKFEDVAKFVRQSAVPVLVVAINGAIATAALVFCVLAMQIRPYEAIADPEDIIKRFGSQQPTDADFNDERLVEFTVAARRNGGENERTARYLAISAALLLVSVVFSMFVFVLGIATWRTA